ncbi:tetratricopeptide repeat protein [Roseibium sp. SCP14]|uniref:tetratricopeptide repeat protein n=1 Tax=Roseibium sp. SCP14 TaxID=3141375 RepID=UPI003336A583
MAYAAAGGLAGRYWTLRLTDEYGNAISTSSSRARDHYDQGLQLFLGANYGAIEAFEDAIAADPGFALGHAAHARALMMSARMPEAKVSIAKSLELAGSADTRERAHIAMMSSLLAGKASETRTAVLGHVREFPRDTMAAQLCTNVFGLIGFSGEPGREAELLAFTEALLPHYGEDWWMMSMHALSLCETGQVDASAELMEKSLKQNPRNANGSHFKAHAQYEVGETAAGRAYLGEWMEAYDDRSVLHGHLTWHLALWALHDGDETAMWEAVDSGVKPGTAKGLPINVLTDTAAILHRAEIAGMTVEPRRWKDLSDYAARCFPQTGQSFADIHAALSHAMAGNGDRLATIAETTKGFAGDLVRPVARAWGEIARGNWSAALSELSAVMATTERLGGSRAQRDLIELAYVNALMKLGHAKEARRTLLTRRPVLSSSPPVAGLN